MDHNGPQKKRAMKSRQASAGKSGEQPRCTKSQRGSMMIMVGFAIIALFGATSLAVDMGYLYLGRQQLQIAADAAALAGVRELAADDQQAARSKATATALANELAGEPVTLDPDSGVVFGRWEDEQFVEGHPESNAMKVTIDRTSNSAQGPLKLFLGPVLGVESADVKVTAIATLAAIDMTLVLDTSSSMTHDTSYRRCTRWLSNNQCGCGTPRYGYQPIDALKAAAIDFVADFDDKIDQVAAYQYANSASKLQSLTDWFDLVTNEIEDIPPPNYCRSTRYTNIGDGIKKGVQELTGDNARLGSAKVMVLLSDGVPTCSRTGYCRSRNWVKADGKAYAKEMAEWAASKHITIQTISLGDGADRVLMREIADITGGNEFYAADGSDLDTVFEDVRKRRPVQLTE